MVNQVCGFLLEFGVVLSRSVNKFAMNVWREALSERTKHIPPLSSNLLDRCVGDFNRLVKHIEECEELIKTQLRNDPVAQKLDTIAGVGRSLQRQLAHRCRTSGSSRTGVNFATSLGLVPLQASSGQTIRLGKMGRPRQPISSQAAH